MIVSVEVLCKRNLSKSHIRIISDSVNWLTTRFRSTLHSSKGLTPDTSRGLFVSLRKPVGVKNHHLTLNSIHYSGGKKIMEDVFNYVEIILESQDKNVSSSLEGRVKSLCNNYTSLSEEEKFSFLRKLACDYDVDHLAVFKLIGSMKSSNVDQDELAVLENKLKTLLTPKYLFLFKIIGRFQNGVKFLVDLRENILQLQTKLTAISPENTQVKQMNLALKNLISDWFSVGFLELQRITWKSSCEMLQKISEYEAVHPMRSWADLKRRVGEYRRCFVYTHFAMPNEPLVVLHTALCKDIVSSTEEIFSPSKSSKQFRDDVKEPEKEANMEGINAAIFYSVSSTQPGLQGIELGNHLIKRVVRELQSELPQITQFSTISPIPGFTPWLMDRFKLLETGGVVCSFPVEEVKPFLVKREGSFWKNLRQLFATNAWYKVPALQSILKEPLMKLCAHYLFNEKKRGYALNSVANFHLRNGAVMWRINWLADVSPRGLSNSCGIMVNYRYFLSDVETNSDNYLKNQIIAASVPVQKLASDRILTSKL